MASSVDVMRGDSAQVMLWKRKCKPIHYSRVGDFFKISNYVFFYFHFF